MVVQSEKRAKSEINLRKLMQKLDMGTNAFAEACGFSSQSMSQFLRKGKSLTTNTIYRIATALDIDPREMFFPTEEEDNNNQENVLDVRSEQANEDTAEQKNMTKETNTPIPTTAYCPHCGAKVRVGVVLLPE